MLDLVRDVLGPVGVDEGVPGLVPGLVRWRDLGDHHSLAVARQRLLQKPEISCSKVSGENNLTFFNPGRITRRSQTIVSRARSCHLISHLLLTLFGTRP